ncbi:MAG: hypothetical protein ACQET8_17170 [Bacillota bacterium]
MERYSITQEELKTEVKGCKKRNGKIIRVPVATNVRLEDGELNYDVEEYLEIPADMIPGYPLGRD